jgi:uncharacterized membrane protein YtjA (UPF0391 family)
MLQLAVAFLIAALITGILGAAGVALLSASVAWILFVVDLVRALVRIARPI